MAWSLRRCTSMVCNLALYGHVRPNRLSEEPDAVDMDVYGAFQLCAIGILTAPITVRISSTYFNNPGRNTIFLWTSLVLTGECLLTHALVFTQGETSVNPLRHD